MSFAKAPHKSRWRCPNILLAFLWFSPELSSQLAAVYETSSTSLHVGHMDWSVPADACREKLECTLQVTNTNATIVIKPIKKERSRDIDKCHGGSARVTFGSHDEAVQGMAALQCEHPEWKVRWATTRSNPNDMKQMPALTQERIQLRKHRAARYARQRQRIANSTDAIIARLQLQATSMNGISITFGNSFPVVDAPAFDWSEVPKEMDPIQGGRLSATDRGERKRAAVEAFVHVLQSGFISKHQRNYCVADLGCGAGNLALPLAWWLQHREKGECRILCVDLNQVSLKQLEDRALAIGLGIETIQLDLLDLIRNHPLPRMAVAVVSLHACGAATDLAIAAAVGSHVPFCVSPCCIGKVNRNRQFNNGMVPASAERSAAPEEITYPRSAWLDSLCTADEYSLLAAAADYAGSNRQHDDDSQESARRQRSRSAKQIVELDRLKWAEERGFVVRLMELPRIGSLYSKRELLLGAPADSSAAEHILRL